MGYRTYTRVNAREFNSTQNNKGHYICNMCGSITTLDDSVSHRGYNLICNKCLHKMRNILGRADILQDIQKVGEHEETMDKLLED